MESYKSRVDYTVSDNTKVTYSFPFQYLKKKFVKVDVTSTDNTVATLTYGVDYTVTDLSITLTAALEVGKTLTIYRETDTDSIVSWNDGSILLAADMSLSDVQMLHLQEEHEDYLKIHSIRTETTEYNESVWDASSHRIHNVADPIDAQDAVTKNYMESVQSGFVQQNTALKNEATKQASAATVSATNAKTSETNSKTSETNVATSAAAAKVSETNSKTSETNAKTSETNAATSETAAATSETNAKTSETNAAASKSSAATSATNAKTSETNSKTSETNASETNAAASKTSAATSAANASTSETNAKYWAESSTSPDGLVDSDSSTGYTQSSKTWAQVAKTNAIGKNTFTGATSSSDGTTGLVPQPKTGEQEKYLKADGTWSTIDLSSKLGNSGDTMHGGIAFDTDLGISTEAVKIYKGQNDTGDLIEGTMNLTLQTSNGVGIVDNCVNNRTTIAFNARTGNIATIAGTVEQLYSQGSNWIRYTSGLQICWGDVSSGNSVSFPQAFKDTPSITCTCLGNSSSYVLNRSTTGFKNNTTLTINYIAVGRWI